MRMGMFLVNLLGACGVMTKKLLLFSSTGCLSFSLIAYNFNKLFKTSCVNGVWLLNMNVILPLPGCILDDLETVVLISGSLISHLKRIVDGSMLEMDKSSLVSNSNEEKKETFDRKCFY